jgi:hypothetical protein
MARIDENNKTEEGRAANREAFRRWQEEKRRGV